jgi:ABC-2 type transport system ATP-binding protein
MDGLSIQPIESEEGVEEMNDTDVTPIAIKNLTRNFRRKEALKNVSFDVPAGCVFGLLGENGAGKSTLIKHVLGALKAKSGTVRTFGMDPTGEPEKVLARIGYLSEDRIMPDWMKIHELIRYTKAFYPNWDTDYAEELIGKFGLDTSQKIKSLSRGERAQAGLIAALAHRPDLLVLDEPSSGLDVNVRRDILGAIVRTVADEGRTVFFSSHLLDEVERVADYMAMIHEGELVLCGKTDSIKESHTLLKARFPTPLQLTTETFSPGILLSHTDTEYAVLCNGQLEELRQKVSAIRGEVIQESTPTLEDIFMGYTK